MEGVGPVSEPSASGARCARTTARAATPGTTSPTIRRARAPTAGARTASPASATTSSGCASRSRCGTAPTRSSRSGCSGSPTARATTARTSRSTGSTSTATPTHSYLKCLYKYPQREFPYEDLVATNGRRGKQDIEYELLDTGVFDEDRYFDVDRRVRQGRPRRHPDAGHRAQPRPGRGDAAPAADAVVPQHVVVGRRRREAHRDGRDGGAGAAPSTRSWASGGCAPTLGAAAVLRERDQQRAPLRRAELLAARQGRDQRLRRRAATPTRSTRRARAPRSPPTTCWSWGRARAPRSACA